MATLFDLDPHTLLSSYSDGSDLTGTIGDWSITTSKVRKNGARGKTALRVMPYGWVNRVLSRGTTFTIHAVLARAGADLDQYFGWSGGGTGQAIAMLQGTTLGVLGQLRSSTSALQDFSAAGPLTPNWADKKVHVLSFTAGPGIVPRIYIDGVIMASGTAVTPQTTNSLYAWYNGSTGGDDFTDVYRVLGTDAAYDAADVTTLLDTYTNPKIWDIDPSTMSLIDGQVLTGTTAGLIFTGSWQYRAASGATKAALVATGGSTPASAQYPASGTLTRPAEHTTHILVSYTWDSGYGGPGKFFTEESGGAEIGFGPLIADGGYGGTWTPMGQGGGYVFAALRNLPRGAALQLISLVTEGGETKLYVNGALIETGVMVDAPAATDVVAWLRHTDTNTSAIVSFVRAWEVQGAQGASDMREIMADYGVVGTRRIKVTWQAPAADGGAPVTGYVVRYMGVGGTAELEYEPSILATSVEVGPAAAGIQVIAVSSLGRSAPAEVSA